MEASSNRRIASPAEAAEILGVSLRTLYRMLAAKELPFIRAGRRYLIPLPALDRLLRGERLDA
jgi:excisionase family DNA binding protein